MKEELNSKNFENTIKKEVGKIKQNYLFELKQLEEQQYKQKQEYEQWTHDLKKQHSSSEFELKLKMEDFLLENKELKEKLNVQIRKNEESELKWFRDRQKIIEEKEQIDFKLKSFQLKVEQSESEQGKIEEVYKEILKEKK